jgi:hypothetical protein
MMNTHAIVGGAIASLFPSHPTLVIAAGFATTIGAILLGAVAAMLPDPLQVVHALYPREPLKSLHPFHQCIHSKRKLS